MIRTSKILCILAIAFYCFLVFFGNISDYFVNFSDVERTLMIKDVSLISRIHYRAITNPVVHHMIYILIIVLELFVSMVCFVGAGKLFKVRAKSADIFNGAKGWAVVGLTLGFLIWQLLFMSVAGEWFGLWMSTSLRGALTKSFQISITFLVLLIYLIIKDE